MAWQNNYKPQSSNYSTSPETFSEDTFISEMLAEYGKFNQDFFVMKMMAKAIDSIGTDPQKFILIIDMLELSLQQSERLTQEYNNDVTQEINEFEALEGREPNDLNKRLEWKTKRAGIKFAVIFGKLSKTQPIEIIGEVDPIKYNAMQSEKEAIKKKARHEDYEEKKSLNSDEMKE